MSILKYLIKLSFLTLIAIILLKSSKYKNEIRANHRDLSSFTFSTSTSFPNDPSNVNQWISYGIV